MARVIAATLAALALWLAYCLSGVAWRLLRIARHLARHLPQEALPLLPALKACLRAGAARG